MSVDETKTETEEDTKDVNTYCVIQAFTVISHPIHLLNSADTEFQTQMRGVLFMFLSPLSSHVRGLLCKLKKKKDLG